MQEDCRALEANHGYALTKTLSQNRGGAGRGGEEGRERKKKEKQRGEEGVVRGEDGEREVTVVSLSWGYRGRTYPSVSISRVPENAGRQRDDRAWA